MRAKGDWLWEELLDIKHSQISQGGAGDKGSSGESRHVDKHRDK